MFLPENNRCIIFFRSGSNCKIYISSSSWGKEEWLVAIASELDVSQLVSRF